MKDARMNIKIGMTITRIMILIVDYWSLLTTVLLLMCRWRPGLSDAGTHRAMLLEHRLLRIPAMVAWEGCCEEPDPFEHWCGGRRMERGDSSSSSRRPCQLLGNQGVALCLMQHDLEDCCTRSQCVWTVHALHGYRTSFCTRDCPRRWALGAVEECRDPGREVEAIEGCESIRLLRDILREPLK